MVMDTVDGRPAGNAASIRATAQAMARAGSAAAVILVEGLTDQLALETAAALRGRDLEAEQVVIVPIGGAHAISRTLSALIIPSAQDGLLRPGAAPDQAPPPPSIGPAVPQRSARPPIPPRAASPAIPPRTASPAVPQRAADPAVPPDSAGSADSLRPAPLVARTRLAGLCDVREEQIFRRGLEAAGLGSPRTRAEMEHLGFHVCIDDLEDELIRAVGVSGVTALFMSQRDLRSFHSFQKQPAWRGQDTRAQMHRFVRSSSRRNLRYAQLLVEAAVAANALPRPLDAVLNAV
ncbi:TOPRIM nucleotidyl transferase/hydrolase domain-containing protein [Actinoplanes missouriensis]|uniref:TOPRIM nucleotidyl transferase/hydrolase domain-containing protein n=1 Tax=Actinoplanes missouriensis TaxID=1866 RepID=UPI0033CF632E